MGRPIIKFSKRYGKVLGSINPDNHYPLYMFMYIIIMYALENNSAFNALSKHKLSAIHFIRMQVDCCLEVYALKIKLSAVSYHMYNTINRTDNLCDNSCNRRTDNACFKHNNEQQVENYI